MGLVWWAQVWRLAYSEHREALVTWMKCHIPNECAIFKKVRWVYWLSMTYSCNAHTVSNEMTSFKLSFQSLDLSALKYHSDHLCREWRRSTLLHTNYNTGHQNQRPATYLKLIFSFTIGQPEVWYDLHMYKLGQITVDSKWEANILILLHLWN